MRRQVLPVGWGEASRVTAAVPMWRHNERTVGVHAVLQRRLSLGPLGQTLWGGALLQVQRDKKLEFGPGTCCGPSVVARATAIARTSGALGQQEPWDPTSSRALAHAQGFGAYLPGTKT